MAGEPFRSPQAARPRYRPPNPELLSTCLAGSDLKCGRALSEQSRVPTARPLGALSALRSAVRDGLAPTSAYLRDFCTAYCLPPFWVVHFSSPPSEQYSSGALG